MVVKAEVQKESCLLTAGNSFIVLWWVSGTSTFYIFRTLLTANPSIMFMSCTWILTLIAVSLASFLFQTEGVEKFFGFLRQRVFGDEVSFQGEVGRLGTHLSDRQMLMMIS